MRCAWLLTVTTREPGTGSICSSSSPVRAKWPRWLVPSCSSNPSRVICLGGNITPALLISRSIRGCRARSSPAAARMDSSEARSRGWTVTSAPGAVPAMRAAAALPLPVSRTASTTDAPRAARIPAVSNPRPVFAPVTTASRPRLPGPAPTDVTVYELTDAGRALQPALNELLHWGLRYAPEPSQDAAAQPGWGLLGAAGRPAALPAGQTCELRVGPEVFYLGSDAGTLTVRRGPAPDGDAVVTMPAGTLYSLLTGQKIGRA